MRTLLRALTLVLSLPAAALSQNPDARARADDLLKQARAAIGDEARLKSLHSLSVSGALRRVIGESLAESEIEYDILLPDKFRRSESRRPFTAVTVIEEGRIWTDLIPTPSGGRGQAPQQGDDPRARARREAAQRADFTRMMLAWLLTTPSFEPAEYSYAGQAEGPGGPAEMVDVKGQGDFRARLYLDQKTHRLLVLTFRRKKLSDVLRTVGPPPGGLQPPPPDERRLTPEQQQQLREERQAAREKWRKEFQEALAQAPEVEVRLVPGKYRKVGGVHLPHHLAKFEDGSLFEEWEITRFKLNPKFTASMFEIGGKQ